MGPDAVDGGVQASARNGGPEGAEIIAVGAPSNQDRDVQVVQGWWAD